MTRDEQLAWLKAHAASNQGLDVDAPDDTTAACLRVLQTHGDWYSDPVMDPESVLDIVEAVRAQPAYTPVGDYCPEQLPLVEVGPHHPDAVTLYRRTKP